MQLPFAPQIGKLVDTVASHRSIIVLWGGRVGSGDGIEEEKIESFLFSPLLSSLLHPLPSFPIQVSKSTALTLHASTSVDGV